MIYPRSWSHGSDLVKSQYTAIAIHVTTCLACTTSKCKRAKAFAKSQQFVADFVTGILKVYRYQDYNGEEERSMEFLRQRKPDVGKTSL